MNSLKEYIIKPSISSARSSRQSITSDVQMIHIKEIIDEPVQFLNKLDKCFDTHLNFDPYDTYYFIDARIKEKYPKMYIKHNNEWHNTWNKWHQSKTFWFDKIDDPHLHQEIKNFQSFRKRGCYTYYCYRLNNSWKVVENGNPIFQQQVEDKRSKPRQFTEIPLIIRRHPDFLKLITWVSELVWRRPIQNPKLQVTCHFMRTYANPAFDSNPAPEGIHRDGANYIVSGLILKRHNVSGGMSKVYLADKKSLIFNRELQEGEGIFQADEENLYWHSVTSIKRKIPNESGWRSIIGFDIVVKN